MPPDSQLKTWRDIPGYFDFQDIYDQAVLEARDGARFVEVGTFLGKSAAYMAERILEARKEITFTCVDTWEKWWDVENDPPRPWPVEELNGLGLFEAFAHCIHSVGAQRLILPQRQSSVAAAGTFCDQSLDFVFIDADHSYESVSADIAAWRHKVKRGGILAGHDYHSVNFPGVVRAVDEEFAKRQHRGNSWFVRF